MKAVIYNKYGNTEVLKSSEVEKPLPKENEVLIKVYATSVTSGDVRLRASDFPPLFWLPARLIFGLFSPKKKILGHEFSGIIEEIGKEVKNFKIGDEVFGTTTMLNTGAYAEYVCVPEQWKSGVIARKPENLNFKESAVLPIGGMTALFLLKKARIEKGHKVLIYGASGSVGSYAIQLTEAFGASATGVCSTKNFEMVESLGADEVLDYTKEDITDMPTNFDIVFDAIGKISKAKAKKILKKNGRFVTVKMLTKERTEDLLRLKELAENGKIKPFIDTEYSLEEIAKAHAYVDTRRKRGNVVIAV